MCGEDRSVLEVLAALSQPDGLVGAGPPLVAPASVRGTVGVEIGENLRDIYHLDQQGVRLPTTPGNEQSPADLGHQSSAAAADGSLKARIYALIPDITPDEDRSGGSLVRGLAAAHVDMPVVRCDLDVGAPPVSYTHLTLPTILRV